MLLNAANEGLPYGGLVYVHGISDGEMDDLFEEEAFPNENFTIQ